MLKSAGKPLEIVIDLGYARDKDTGERADKLLAFGMGIRNFVLEVGGRLVMKCPGSKLKKVMEAFPVVEGTRYWMTTHYWKDGN